MSTNTNKASAAMIAAGVAAAVEANSMDALSAEQVESIYDAMRTQFNKENEANLMTGVSVEMAELLKKTTITTHANEKFVVEGTQLLIEDEEGKIIEERPLVGREAQLIATIMFNQRHFQEYLHGKEWIIKNPGEPYFILLGRDPQAPDLVRTWANDRLTAVTDDLQAQAKAHQAFQIAGAMQQYKTANPDAGMPSEMYKPALSIQDFLARYIALSEEAAQYGYFVLIQLKAIDETRPDNYYTQVEILTREEAMKRCAAANGQPILAIDVPKAPEIPALEVPAEAPVESAPAEAAPTDDHPAV